MLLSFSQMEIAVFILKVSVGTTVLTLSETMKWTGIHFAGWKEGKKINWKNEE